MAIDFVHHGDAGLAGPWAAAARPGDRLRLLGPGGAYAPDPVADWHLLVGDEAALPAIGAAMERMPAGVPAVAVVQVGAADEEQELPTPAALDLRWLHRDAAGGDPESTQLVDAVRALEFPSGRVHAFVHGEAVPFALCAGICCRNGASSGTRCRCPGTGAAGTTTRRSASSRRPSGSASVARNRRPAGPDRTSGNTPRTPGVTPRMAA